MSVRKAVESERGGQRRIFCGIWLVFFLQGMVPGFWFPALTNILNAQGLGSWVKIAFLVPPIGALISPLLAGLWPISAFQRTGCMRIHPGSVRWRCLPRSQRCMPRGVRGGLWVFY
jgi:hypothetical protein